MTERKRSKTPVSSFGPELLAALIKGASAPLELRCPTSAVATKLVQRLYTLRKRMREENHPQAELVQRAKVSNQRNRQHTETIRISPHDYEFRDIMRNAGIDVEAVSANLLGDLAKEQGAQDGAITPHMIAPFDPDLTPSAPPPGFLASIFKEYK